MDPSNKITTQLSDIHDWRGDNETAPELSEDFKWGVPVWTNNGLVCAISAFKNHVKINFFKGAYLPDPKKLFNSGLDSKTHRSINLSIDDKLNKAALKELVILAVAYNQQTV